MKKYILLIAAISSSVALCGQQIKPHIGDPQAVEYKDWKFNLPAGYQDGITAPKSRQAVQLQSIDLKTAKFSKSLGLDVIERYGDRVTMVKPNANYKPPSSKSFVDHINVYLKTASPLLEIKDADQAFEMINSSRDDRGSYHYRMQHMYKGVHVYGSEVMLHSNDGTQIDVMNGRYYDHPESLDVNPSIDLPTSQAALVDAVGILEVEDDPLGLFDFDKITSELVIYPIDGGFKLVYHHVIVPEVGQRWEYFVDANDGVVIDKYLSVCKLHNHELSDHTAKCNHNHLDTDEVEVDMPRARQSLTPPPDGPIAVPGQDLFNRTVNVQSYEVNDVRFMIDASKVNIFNGAQSDMPDAPVGAIWTIDGNNRPFADREWSHVFTQGNWSDKRAEVSAHVNGSEAFDYFEEKFGRRSINGMGGNIVSLVNILDEDGNGLDNAFWDGQFMYYGGGRDVFLPLARGLDVAAHEMSHGVIQNTANLVYRDQSGSLNESFADIFGAMVDRDDWQIGEDVIRPDVVSPNLYPLGALRSMEDPNNGVNDANITYSSVGKGWQPKHMNEFFDDVQNLNQGGVHINSGIPNHAYYLFAEAVGKDVAEQVYYRALTQYLTRSSEFVDARAAVLLAAEVEGQAVVDAAASAWAAVGIGGSSNPPSGPSICEDLETNPGQALVLLTNSDQTRLDLFAEDGTWLTQQANLADVAPLSKPSVTDNGNTIMYVGTDNRIHLITFDWSAGTFQNSIFQNDQVWRNVVISRDGRLIAATTTAQDNRVIIYDAVSDSQQNFFLFNPTFTQGVDAGDVNYSDAMEFDHSGQTLVYDAFNTLQGTSGTIEYWDIGLIDVWDRSIDNFGSGDIQKLFTGLSEGESVGNPTFSKNSDCVIAFDYINVSSGQPLYSLWAVNIEEQEVGILYENLVLSWPSYSPNDERLVHDASIFGDADLGILNLRPSKIETVPNTEDIFVQGGRLGTFFANGERSLVSSLSEVTEIENNVSLTPNPTTGRVVLTMDVKDGVDVRIVVTDILGQTVLEQRERLTTGHANISIDLSSQVQGQYTVSIHTASGVTSEQVIKLN
jgi:Zn-dependent metalloprotease